MNRAEIPQPRRIRRRKSRKNGPLFSTVYLSLIGLYWVTLITLALIYLRPHPLAAADFFVGGLGFCIAGFYLWAAWGVYMRRNYIYTPAFACGSFGILAFPLGTALAVLLIFDLAAHRHEFDK